MMMQAGALTRRHSRLAGLKDIRGSSGTLLALIAFLALAMASVANHVIAAMIGLVPPGATYRRIGPETGPQVFVAGSSLLQFGLAWPEVSEALGQGIENWGVGGSSPEIWEVSQPEAARSNLMIVGVSAYDLNEYHLANGRANIVPLSQTVRDLRDSRADWQLSRRVLSQYPLAYLRLLFPAAGDSDAVLVGVRRIARQTLGLASAARDQANALVLPDRPVLEFGPSTERISDWDPGRTLRRLALVRSENRGRHAFNGPKQLAFRRMLRRAQDQGRVIIVVLPVADAYEREFLSPEIVAAFEKALLESHGSAPGATIVRLDKVPQLGADEHFSDFVHLNSAGRAIATQAFLDHLKTLSDDSI
jgi:hypothetical protein